MAENKLVTIYTHSRYAFVVVHDFGLILNLHGVLNQHQGRRCSGMRQGVHFRKGSGRALKGVHVFQNTFPYFAKLTQG